MKSEARAATRGKEKKGGENTEISNRFLSERLMLKLTRTVPSQQHTSTVSMAIRRHEIYGKSRRSLSLPNCRVTAGQVCSKRASQLFDKVGLFIISIIITGGAHSLTHTHAHVDMSGRATGVPPHCRAVAGWTSHQTESESSSLPAVIHTVNLIINQPSSPPTAPSANSVTSTFICVNSLNSRNELMRAKTPEESPLTVNGQFFFLFSFTFWEEEEGREVGSSLVTSRGIPPPRDADVVRILVGNQEVRKTANTERNPEGWSCTDKFCFVWLAFLRPLREDFCREIVGPPRSRGKMSKMESILLKQRWGRYVSLWCS